MKILYADLYFFLNLLVDYLLCLATGRLLALPLRRGRYGAAALLGAVYALTLLLPLPPFFSAPPLRLAAGLLMGLIALGREAAPDRKSTRLNSSHIQKSRMPSSA